MNPRPLGRTGWNIVPIGFGAWAIGGDVWQDTDDRTSMAALHAAIDHGVNFIDTADVYGDGHSERLIAQLRHDRSEEIFIATKAGRRARPHDATGYTRASLEGFVGRSLRNLGVDTIDLLQLHCPPGSVYEMPEVFAVLDDFVKAGMIRYYGVSVETTSEAIRAAAYPGVQSVQIIFNMFRHKPAQEFFAVARERQIGILARVPLASGLLTGTKNHATSYATTDHRHFNRLGEAFDRGETFSGVDYATGLRAVEALRALVPSGATFAQLALRWTLMFPEVTVAIPGAKSVAQVQENADTLMLEPLTDAQMLAVNDVYDRYVRELVHAHW